MKYISEELEGLRRLETHPWVPQENNQEMEILIPKGSSTTSGDPSSVDYNNNIGDGR